MCEKLSLIYVPQDHRITYRVGEKKDGDVVILDSFYDWMQRRGSFFKFSVETELEERGFDRSIGLLSALGVPAFVIKNFPNSYSDLFRFSNFEIFARHLLVTWFSKKLSSMFDLKDVVSEEDFKVIRNTFCSNFKNPCVNTFPSLERFESQFSDFLLKYKNIMCDTFYIEDFNEEDFYKSDEEELPW